jgi:hypothetical protein
MFQLELQPILLGERVVGLADRLRTKLPNQIELTKILKQIEKAERTVSATPIGQVLQPKPGLAFESPANGQSK